VRECEDAIDEELQTHGEMRIERETRRRREDRETRSPLRENATAKANSICVLADDLVRIGWGLFLSLFTGPDGIGLGKLSV
jgi:hypothetical protein